MLRNQPFGASLVGADTPFVVGGHGPARADDDDHDGIPTGLPEALGHLDEVDVQMLPATLPDAPVDAGADTLIHRVPELPDSSEVGQDTLVQKQPAFARKVERDPEPEPPSGMVPPWMLAAGTVLGFAAGWAANSFLWPMLG